MEATGEMRNLILRLVIAAFLTSLSTTAIEYFQAPGVVAYWIGLVSGASILALFEVLEGGR